MDLRINGGMVLIVALVLVSATALAVAGVLDGAVVGNLFTVVIGYILGESRAITRTRNGNDGPGGVV